jgi:hypothetical protein
VSAFEIVAEREGPGGWSFEIQIVGAKEGRLRSLTMDLSWSDYGHWTRDGADPASAVAEAVMAFLLDRLSADELPTRFDASLARRRFPGADEEIRSRIRR